MEWVREGMVLEPDPNGYDGLRMWRPWVLEEDDGSLRMWYSGNDGETWRILEAVREPGGGWRRAGVSIDVGAAGESDDFGVQAPCVVRTPGGYLMAYAGVDGDVSRLHMANSTDGHHSEAQGTFIHRGDDDAAGASHPSLLLTGR